MEQQAAPTPKTTPREYLHAVLLGAVVGIPAALVAALFLAAFHYLHHWLWIDLPDALGESSPPWYLVIGLPVVGAAVVLFARLWLPGDGGHDPLEGISVAPTPFAHAPGIALAGLATLSFGAVLGPEAPVVALGGAVALLLTSFARLNEQQRRLLSLAGSFAAISALFGGPLVGGVLLMESAVGLGAQAIPALLPGFVAAAVGYLVFVGLGDWGGLEAPGLVVPALPAYDGTYIVDLLLAVGVGVVTTLAIIPLKQRAARLEELGNARLGMPAFLLAGGLAVGLLAFAADLLGADAEDVLFSGQTSIPALLAETSTYAVVVLLAGQGHRVRREPRLRISRGGHLPGHLPRHRDRDLPGDLVRHVADRRGRNGRGGGYGRAEPPAPVVDAVRRAPRRQSGLRRRVCGRAGRSYGLAERHRARAPHLDGCLSSFSYPSLG